MPLPTNDTIVAIATALFPSGIGVIRISGPDAFSIADRVFEGGKQVSGCKSHTALHGYLRLPDRDERLDEIICLVMRSPSTYTGEDIVELSMHGNPLLMQTAVEAVISGGARQAEAGEFTYRAFMNGKISLTQAEAVHQLIKSRTRSGMRNAFLQLGGSLQKEINSLRSKVSEILSDFEAEIEFPEEGLSFAERKEGIAKTDSLLRRISKLKDSYMIGRKIEDGISIVICGPPNSGKSTLLNRILREERSIVHEQPGTTRDLVEGKTVINGAVIRLLDTAGIRKAGEAVEKIGIKRTKSAIKSADVIVWVESLSEKGRSNDTLFREVSDLAGDRRAGSRFIRLYNKSDLVSGKERKSLQKQLSNGSQSVISAKKGWGISGLKNTISDLIQTLDETLCDGTIISSLRQKQLLQVCQKSLIWALKGLRNKVSLEYVCLDLNDCIKSLDRFTGDERQQDIYELIFKNYCVGK